MRSGTTKMSPHSILMLLIAVLNVSFNYLNSQLAENKLKRQVPLSVSNISFHFFFFRFFTFRFLSLGCVACVYGCLAVDLGIAILVGMWPRMYVDVNECNVCSICMFWIQSLLFHIAEVLIMGLLEVRLSIVTVSFCFQCSIPFHLINLGFVDLFVLFDFCSFGLWFVFWVLISLCVLWVDFSCVWVGYDFSVLWLISHGFGLVLISLFFG